MYQLSSTVTAVSNVANYASSTVDNLSGVVYSVSLIAHAAYDNKLGLSETVDNLREECKWFHECYAYKLIVLTYPKKQRFHWANQFVFVLV